MWQQQHQLLRHDEPERHEKGMTGPAGKNIFGFGLARSQVKSF